MIIVTGATGQLGHSIVEHLLRRVPAADIGVSVRSPEKARSLADRGIDVREGNFDDSQSLRTSFAGASQVLLISSATHGDDALRQHRNAIEAARTAGVRRIVYTSHMGSNPASHFAAMRDHAATEEMLRDSGLAFTSLRNGYYAASALLFMRGAKETGKFFAPEDGPVSWTTHADLSEVAALSLVEPGLLDGLTSALTGQEALDLADLAAIASDASGQTITRVTVSDEQYLASLTSHGVPESHAQFLLGIFAASRQGEFARTDPTLERLLGRSPIGMREVVGRHMSR